MTTLRKKVIKNGAKLVAQTRYVIFQMAEVAVPRQLFAGVLERIRRLRPPTANGAGLMPHPAKQGQDVRLRETGCPHIPAAQLKAVSDGIPVRKEGDALSSEPKKA